MRTSSDSKPLSGAENSVVYSQWSGLTKVSSINCLLVLIPPMNWGDNLLATIKQFLLLLFSFINCDSENSIFFHELFLLNVDKLMNPQTKHKQF